MKKSVLSNLGFQKNWTYEVIVITIDEKGNPHAAVMGVSSPDLVSVSMEIYSSSRTIKNILSTKKATVNFCQDLDLYKKILLEEDFTFRFVGEQTIIGGSKGYLALQLTSQVKEANSTRLQFEIVEAKVDGKPGLFNRAESAFLEALIAYSKEETLGREKMLSDLKEHSRIINKVAPSSCYCSLISELLAKAKK
ncbi:MAG: DUF447 domain-containing protein [Candidatus Altiarchaeota archaeon]